MNKYYELIKYLNIFRGDEKEDEGAVNQLIRVHAHINSCYVSDFIEDVHNCANQIGVNNYVEVLNQHNIEWDFQSMSCADAKSLSPDVICALLLGAVRAEKFCEGTLIKFIKNGCINKWLKELESKAEDKKVSYIKIDDLLRISDEDATNVKVKFNQNDGNENPMELYLSDPEIVNSQWLFWRNKQRYFNVGQVAICLLKLSYDTWLLTTIKRVTDEYGVYNGINYSGEEISEYSQYFGRVIIKYHKTAQTQGMFYNTVKNELEVLEILPNMFDGDEFPGYDKVRLSYMQLCSIIERQKKSWVAALENQKAVYLTRIEVMVNCTLALQRAIMVC